MQSTGRWPMADTFAADSVKSDRLEVEHDVTFMRETVCKLQLAAKHITRQNETICQLQAALEESEKMVELKDAFETKAKDLQRELEKAKKVVADDNQQISFLEDENHKLETQAKLFRAETNDTKLHFKENKQSLESISERYYRLESESRLLFMQGHEIERKNEKKISDLKEMLSLEQQKSEDYLEKALTHERTCGELISTVAAMKNTIDELQAKLKDIDMLETMFCELKEKYATVKLDNSSTMVDSEKVMQAKNAEIDRLNDSLEKSLQENLSLNEEISMRDKTILELKMKSKKLSEDLLCSSQNETSLKSSLSKSQKQSEALRREISSIEHRIESFSRLLTDLTSQNTTMKHQIEEFDRKEKYNRSVRSLAVAKPTEKHFDEKSKLPLDRVKLW